MEKSQEKTYCEIFQDTEDFLHHFNPREYTSPFMSTTFSAMRSTAYRTLQRHLADDDESTKDEKMLTFVKKFESEYVDVLKAKLREHYVDIVLRRHVGIPQEVQVKEVESYGAVSELAQLGIAIAEWALEVEANAYTFEGLKLYGLWDDDHEDYVDLLKKGYNYRKKGVLSSTAGYLFRQALDYLFGKISTLALAKGMSKGGFQGKDILDIILAIVSSGVVPWKAVAGLVNVSWVVGGFGVSMLLSYLNQFLVKRQVFNTLNTVQENFENNTLLLLTERKTVLDLMERVLTEKDPARRKWELKVLAREVSHFLEPAEEIEDAEKELHEIEMSSFHVKEEGDCVVVDQKHFKEIAEENGVIVVDW